MTGKVLVRSSSAGGLPVYWVPPLVRSDSSLIVHSTEVNAEAVADGLGVFSPSNNALRDALMANVHSRRFRE